MLHQFSPRAFAALTVLVTATLGSEALAQTATDRGYIGLKTGANLEHAEDGVAGEAAGFGVEAGLTLNRSWSLEFEAWVPGYFETTGGRHRDILFNFSAIRFSGQSGVRSFVVIGAGFGTVQQRFESQQFDSSASYLVLGGGVQVPVGNRLAIVPEVRVNYAMAAIIVRPQVGVRLRF